MGALCARFVFVGTAVPILFLGDRMKKSVRHMVNGAIIAAMYAALCHLQNIMLPGSASLAIQFRVAEALCVLALFTPAAVPGLTVGCAVFNLTFAGALPLDAVLGTLATYLACQGMWLLRKYPWAGFALPAVTNAFLVGWELTVYLGNAFWLNALYVAIGEVAVLYTLGAALYAAMKKHAHRLF